MSERNLLSELGESRPDIRKESKSVRAVGSGRGSTRREKDEPEHLDLTESSLRSSLVSNEESSLVEPDDGSTSDKPAEGGERVERSEVVGRREEEEDRSEHPSSGGEHHLGTGIVLVHQIDVVLVKDL